MSFSWYLTILKFQKHQLFWDKVVSLFLRKLLWYIMTVYWVYIKIPLFRIGKSERYEMVSDFRIDFRYLSRRHLYILQLHKYISRNSLFFCTPLPTPRRLDLPRSFLLWHRRYLSSLALLLLLPLRLCRRTIFYRFLL